MLKVRFINNADITTTKIDNITKYHELPKSQFLDIFMPTIKKYKIVEEYEESDICIVGTQHIDNSLLRENEFNIFFTVENFSAGRNHYQHYNKFGRNGNTMIDLYIYNDITIPTNNMIPSILLRISYFNKLTNINNKLYYEKAREFYNKLNTPFQEKKFCLFISQNMLNPNKEQILNTLCKLGDIDFLHVIAKHNIKLQTANCFNSFELLNLFNKYKFIICFENSKTPGYITEKIFNVFLSKSIPIYDGDPEVDKFINNNTYISFDEYTNKKVELLMNNETLYNNIINRDKVKDIDLSFINTNFHNILTKKIKNKSSDDNYI